MTDTRTMRSMSLFGRRQDSEDVRAERAHQAIENAQAGLAHASARGKEARSNAFELAGAEVHSGQVHVDVTMERADEQLAQIVDDAEVEAYRTIHSSQYQQQPWSCRLST